jgi:H+/Cl- antiporter ClcA
MVLLMPVLGLAIAGLAIAFAQGTDHGSSQVLFSGENALAPMIQQAATWTAGALVLLVVCKGLAYTLSLSSFRGGPTFPGLFIGAAGGMALSHLAGLPMIAGAAMGMGAMTTVMLGLPLTSVLIATIVLPSDSLALMPLVIVAVVVAYVGTARLAPEPESAPAPATPAEPPPAEVPARDRVPSAES